MFMDLKLFKLSSKKIKLYISKSVTSLEFSAAIRDRLKTMEEVAWVRTPLLLCMLFGFYIDKLYNSDIIYYTFFLTTSAVGKENYTVFLGKLSK